jgi:serine/threonine protein kinase
MAPSGTISPEHRLALPAGFRLEEYRILKVLGQGGFGITYLAEDIRMNHRVAIKELLPKDFATRSEDYTVVPLTQSDEPDLAWAKESFIEEARILVRLNHPNIVRFFRYFELNSTAYLVMAFVPGQNFKDWMQRHWQPGERELKALLLPLLDGLEYVHQQHLLHRDISPENVMINEAGHPILLDFGSARAALGTNPKTEVVRRGFSPIEQYQRNSLQGPYTDLYALAGIMIQAISGEAPPDSIGRYGTPDPYQPVIRRLRGRYSEGFLRALDAAFALWAKDRPQSVERWRQMLENSSQPPKRLMWSSLIAAGVTIAIPICGALYYFGIILPAQERERQLKITQEQAAAQDREREAEIAKEKAEARERDRLAKLPKTLVVPDQYARIQSAIDAAKAGDTVQVKAGVYHEALKFKEGIELLGADRDTTIVSYHTPPTAVSKDHDYDPVLAVYHCRTGRVANLTFEAEPEPPSASGTANATNAIDITDSSITVENCSAISAAASGIGIHGAGSAPSLIGNRCNSCNYSGIEFDQHAQGKAAQNICERNLNGIFVADAASPVLTGNQCRANRVNGIDFFEGEGKAVGNICEGNAMDGINLELSSPFLGGNQLSENGNYGLRYDSASKPGFGEPNKIFGNKAGDISAETPTPTPKPAPVADGFLSPLRTPTLPRKPIRLTAPN